MYGRINFGQIIFTIVFVSVFVTASTYFMLVGGTLTIERPYLNELNSCKVNLEQEQARLTPECSPCLPTRDNGYHFLWVLGLMFYGGSLANFIWRTKRLDNREEELKKREAEIIKKEKKSIK